MPTKQLKTTESCIPRINLLWSVLLAAGLSVWLFALSQTGAERAWLGLLVNFLYFGPLAAGLTVWLAIIAMSRGGWAKGYEHLAANGILAAGPVILALAALWLGSSQWSPWLGRNLPQGVWLDTNFVLGRDLASLTLFWLFAWFYLGRRQRGKRGGAAGALFILAYGVVFSLLGFDLVMALDPAWHSSLFGGYFAVSGLYMAVAALAFMASWQPRPRLVFLHDIGKLLLAFSLLTTYLMFSQLLPIWYENLPGETTFVFARLQVRPASALSALLLVVIYLGPLVLLLTVWAKQHRYYLGAVSGLVLLGMWL
ncbi:MAG: hypothetical protein M0P70_18295, partial [Desulfobulbaceae bacterium]|nr:hypothetical protein [Desulfobulbaceae bacterium]